MASEQVVIKPGMSEQIDARHLPTGTPRLLQNIRVRQGARFEKRPGQSAVATTGLPTAGSGCWVAPQGTRPVFGVQEVDSSTSNVAQSVYQFDGAAWSYAGRHGICMPERRVTVSQTPDGTASPNGYATSVVISGLIYVAYFDDDNDSVRLMVVDDRGHIFRAATLSDAASPRLVYDGTTLYLVTREPSGAGTDIEVRTVTLSSLALSAATTLATTLSGATATFDCAPYVGSSDWLIAHPEDATHVRVRRMTGTTSTYDTTIVTTNAPSRVGIAGDTTTAKVWVGYTDGITTVAEAAVLAPDLASQAIVELFTISGSAVEFTHQVCPVQYSATEYAFLSTASVSATGTFLSRVTYYVRANTSAALTTTAYQATHWQMASKPFAVGALGDRQVLCWAHNRNATGYDEQAVNVLLDFSEQVGPNRFQIAAISYQHLPFPADGDDNDNQSHLPEVVSLGSGRYAATLWWRDFSHFLGLDLLVYWAALRSESVSGSARPTATSQGVVHVGGGCLYELCDLNGGTSYLPENGFCYGPVLGAVAAAAGGSLTTGETYTYRSCYRWQDTRGRVHRSAPGNDVTFTPSGGNLTATVRVEMLAGSGRRLSSAGPVVQEIYRSWNGGPFYYVAETATAIETSSTYSVTINDTASDASVESNYVLYTDLGVIENRPADGVRLMAEGGTRIFTVGWREDAVQFSKLLIPTAPVEFCDDDAFRIFVPAAITALGWMDGALVIFTANQIYLVSGDGPNDQGVGSYSDPRELPVSVGCDEPRSVVETPMGLMFKGAGTIWLIPRGFGPPQPIGDDVQSTLASYPYVLSASMCANGDDECVHFLVSSSDTAGAERALVYNTRIPGWYVDTLGCTVGAAGAVDGKFTLALATWSAAANVPVRQFSASARQDYNNSATAAWIESKVAFGDWRPFGPLGWGHFRQLQIHGEAAGFCSVYVVVTVDGALYTTVGHPTTYTTNPVTFAAAAEFYLKHIPRIMMGGSFRFDIYDAESNGKTAGMAIHSVAFEADAEEGLRREVVAEVM
jgi:hypothetical protein